MVAAGLAAGVVFGNDVFRDSKVGDRGDEGEGEAGADEDEVEAREEAG